MARVESPRRRASLIDVTHGVDDFLDETVSRSGQEQSPTSPSLTHLNVLEEEVLKVGPAQPEHVDL